MSANFQWKLKRERMCCEMARKSKRKGEGHGIEDRKSLLHRRCSDTSTNFTTSLGCLGLCPSWPEANVHHWSKESGRGQWPWIGLKDANIGAKWLVILLEHAVGGGQRFRGYSRHNTTALDAYKLRCACTHIADMCFCCAHARTHACTGIITAITNQHCLTQM